MKQSLILLLITIVFFSCSKENDKEALYKEVITLHDEVMPKMEEVSKLSQDLKMKAETISSNKSSDKSDLTPINKSIEDLANSSRNMMKWMREFNSSYDTLPEEAAVKYLKEEKLEIEQVKKDMLSAIEEGKKNL
jgi:hypothetical protein